MADRDWAVVYVEIADNKLGIGWKPNLLVM